MMKPVTDFFKLFYVSRNLILTFILWIQLKSYFSEQMTEMSYLFCKWFKNLWLDRKNEKVVLLFYIQVRTDLIYMLFIIFYFTNKIQSEFSKLLILLINWVLFLTVSKVINFISIFKTKQSGWLRGTKTQQYKALVWMRLSKKV